MSDFMRGIPITPDMVSLWVPSGLNRAQDLIRSNHGQCYGTHPNVPVGSARINPSVGWHFDGVDDYVEIAGDVSLDTPNALTVAAWIYDSGGGSNHSINKDDGTASRCWIVLRNSDTVGNWIVWNSDDTIKQFTPAGSWAMNQWFHIACTAKVVGVNIVMEVFFNSVSKGTTSFPGTAIKVATSQPIRIGWDAGGYRKQFLVLPFVANPAWSVAQVKNFYLATKGVFAPRG